MIVKVPFYRKTIPVDRIKKLESARGVLQPKHLKLTYEDGNQTVKFIRFFSVNPSNWFDELQKFGIKTEDTEGLRGVKDDRVLQFAKKLNLSAGIIAAVAAVAGLLIVLIVFIAGRIK